MEQGLNWKGRSSRQEVVGIRDVLPAVTASLSDGGPVALVTVVGVHGSAPRPVGAAMAVGPTGEVHGSVSGGCVEGAAVAAAERVVATGRPELVEFGIDAEQALAVGLPCGGRIQLWIERIDQSEAAFYREIKASIDADEPVALVTVIRGCQSVGRRMAVWDDRTSGSLGDAGLEGAVRDDVRRRLLSEGVAAQLHYDVPSRHSTDQAGVFVSVHSPRPRMLIFGAVDFASALARLGAFLGYRVTVCDARDSFATPSRFPYADEVVVKWPHRFLEDTPTDRQTVICVLTHDPKFDIPVLEIALRRPSAYVGAMGSRRTHADRIARLKKRGLTDEELARLHSPIGIDLGARTPQETAVSIAGEIIKGRRGGTGRSLSAIDGPIHGEPAGAGARSGFLASGTQARS